jgi:(p)ppGpp synthase/HD superfamily hydrolase
MDEDQRLRFTDAFAFVLARHAGQTRKGGDVPYVSHLVQVAGLVLEHGGDAIAATAALLHDVVEDCEDVHPDDVRRRYGEAVADIVDLCTDLLEGDRTGARSPWHERKRRFLSRLPEADARTRLVVACDKLHNLRNLASDLEQEGLGAFDRFNATPTQTRWYYESVRELIGAELPARLRGEFDEHLARLREHVPERWHPEEPEP